jgi:hypothetical protein
MTHCTKTPTSQCHCDRCWLVDLYDERQWLVGMSRSGAMSQIENESRIESIDAEIRRREGCAS